MDQESDLENWARVNGYWYDNPQEYYKSLGYKFYGYGGEAQVYTEGDTYVHKVCRIDAYFRFNTPGLGLGGKFLFGK